jgi:hypothetical protein
MKALKITYENGFINEIPISENLDAIEFKLKNTSRSKIKSIEIINEPEPDKYSIYILSLFNKKGDRLAKNMLLNELEEMIHVYINNYNNIIIEKQ